MDGAHFRRRAAEARAMAGLGQDMQLCHLLLEVAQDLEAEAAVIDAGVAQDRRICLRVPGEGIAAILRPLTTGAIDARLVLTNFSQTGAHLRGRAMLTPGIEVCLDLPSCSLRLLARVMRSGPEEVALRFATDPETVASIDRAYPHVISELGLSQHDSLATCEP